MAIAKRVVSIGAHSLDAELLGGPLLIKYANEGAHCTTIHITQGRLEDENATQVEKDAYLKKLLDQNKAAAKCLGADTLWLGYVSSNMPSTEEFADKLIDYFEKEKVDLVITHWKGSCHPRHVATHEAVTLAVKKMCKQGREIKLMYGETFEDLVGFLPQAYFELDDNEIKVWFKALKCYDVFNGEINDLPYYEYYSSILKVRSFECSSNKKAVCYMYPSLIQKQLF